MALEFNLNSQNRLTCLDFNAIFEFLGQLTIRCILFFKKVLTILRKSAKHVNFWLGVQFPL